MAGLSSLKPGFKPGQVHVGFFFFFFFVGGGARALQP
jgi:hypothetical protein